MKKNTLSSLEESGAVLSIKKVALTDKIKEKLGDDLYSVAKKNSLKIDIYHIIYESKGHKVVGYIVEPKKGDSLPCIVYNRGGSKDFGQIKLGQLFLNLSKFALQGYITIMTQYSGNAGGEGVDEMGGDDIFDVIELFSVLKKHPRADVNRIGMYGASRGGMMTYITLTKVDWIKAAVVISGSTDLVNNADFRPNMESRYKEMFGGDIEEKKKRSVIFWADKLPKNVPLLIMHGTADWRVNPSDSLKLSEELLKNQVPYRLVMFEGADHFLSEFKDESSDFTIKWFDKYVKNTALVPNVVPHGD